MALDTTEVARAVQLDPADTHVGLIVLMLDLNRDKKVNFREYLIAAYAVGQKEQSSEDKTRFCFSMIDKNNNGIVSARSRPESCTQYTLGIG
jgi:Ca2+-binding EF-hand superfamily protein